MKMFSPRLALVLALLAPTSAFAQGTMVGSGAAEDSQAQPVQAQPARTQATQPQVAQTQAAQTQSGTTTTITTEGAGQTEQAGPSGQAVQEGVPTVAAPGTPQVAAQGQWVYTDEYGWLWVPNGSTTVIVQERPYVYLYTPAYGWTWYGSPWGPGPYYAGAWVHHAWGPVHVWHGGGWYAPHPYAFHAGYRGPVVVRGAYRGGAYRGGPVRGGGGHHGGGHR